jgi:DNA-directed RNA polymerase sigma subunit (sigma70/sigma32)
LEDDWAARSLDDDAPFADDALSVYLSECQRTGALSREEEIDCVGHVRSGDQLASAGKRLAEANLLLVVSIAERIETITLVCWT